MSADRTPDAAVTLSTSSLAEMSGNERIKRESQGLFAVSDGKGVHGFRDEIEALEQGTAPTLSSTAKELSKFYGIYKQQVRGARGKKTHDYIFMVRIKNPAGGRLTASQWLALDEAADQFADGSLRITSRQGVQYHGVTGQTLAPLVRHLNRRYRDSATLGACGDVNRNVMCSPIDGLDPERACAGLELAHAIADELSPRTSAYFEVFLSDEAGKSLVPMNPSEPLYGEQYLPRKFKIGIAHATDNSVDLRTNDIGLLPSDAEGSHWDVWTGGGLGLTHNNPRTAALLGEYIGRVARAQVVDLTRAIVLLQKEHGERGERRQARWKYTLRRLGIAAVRSALKGQYGIALDDAEPVTLPPMQLHLGWHAQRGGASYYGVSVQNGRLKGAQRAALREAVEKLGLSVVLTPQQDLILCDVADRGALEVILDAHGVARAEQNSKVRANAKACHPKPTCGLAMTDAENVLPSYVEAIEQAGLGDVDAVIRMTGCPNNCVRPPSSEVGIYGYGKNDHVVLVGGSRNGDRLAHVLYARISEDKMVPALVGLFRAIREHNPEKLPPGDFLHRTDPVQLRRWVGVEDGA
jgi:sulfite reductase (ferredoxin)